LSKTLSVKEALRLLRKAGCAPNVVKHCKTVADLATRIAQQIARNGTPVDVHLVTIGALLHDIGRAQTHEIKHAIIGAKIARSFDLPEAIVQIVERHIGSGITAKEAARLGLPKRSFLPKSLEEKIVAYSDKLVKGGQEVDYEEALSAFSINLGGFLGPPAIKRFKKLHYDISSVTGDSQ
jgi:uncharacterized protein